MLKTQCIGNLTADPKIVNSAAGSNFLSFTVAHNERGANGEQLAVFIQCTAFFARLDAAGKPMGRDLAGIIQRYFHKGDPIYLEGRISAGHYQAQDGSIRDQLRMTVTDFAFCGKTNNAEAAAPVPASAQGFVAAPAQQVPMRYSNSTAGFTAVETDELPF